MNIKLEEVLNFCAAHACNNCPLLDDELGATYTCGLGLFIDSPDIAEDMIKTWQKEEEKRKIDKRQTVYAICDKFFVETVYGVASSREKAEEMVEALAQNSLADCLAVDTEDSGIHWEGYTKEQQEQFYNEQIKSSFVIKEMKMDCYELEEEVHTI